jgi:hypothetical protein
MNPAPVSACLPGGGLLVLVASLLLPLPARSSVTERLPAGNTGNAATVMPAILEKTNKVRIDYADNRSVVITDEVSIGRLKALLGGAKYKPTPYCFCYTPGGVILLADDSELVRFTVPHGMKLRFARSSLLSGDYIVEKAACEAILALVREKQSLAVAQSPSIPPKPALPEKLEFKP